MYLENVREFLALCKHGSFVDAAEHSFVSQSSFTKHLKDMEAELGVILFERTTRSVVLTETGKKLIAFATDILSEWEAFFADIGGCEPRYDVKTTDLRRFVVLCGNNSYTKASRDLGISQATLTQTVKRLEKLLGQSLLDRSTHGMILCPTGEKLLRRAQKIIYSETGARFSVKNMITRDNSMLRIGVDPAALNTSQLNKMLSVLPTITDLDVSVCETDSDMLLRGVKEGFYELAVILSSAPIDSDVLHVRQISSTGFSIFHNHGSTTAEALYSHPLCLWKQDTAPFQEALRHFRGGPHRIHIHYCGCDIHKLSFLIRHGLPALLPQSAMDADLGFNELPVFEDVRLYISLAAQKEHSTQLDSLMTIIESALSPADSADR